LPHSSRVDPATRQTVATLQSASVTEDPHSLDYQFFENTEKTVNTLARWDQPPVRPRRSPTRSQPVGFRRCNLAWHRI